VSGYRERVEIALLVIAVVVALLVLANSPASRAFGRTSEQENDAWAGGADVKHQFKRPRNEGDLF
jgi:hypothetical protein